MHFFGGAGAHVERFQGAAAQRRPGKTRLLGGKSKFLSCKTLRERKCAARIQQNRFLYQFQPKKLEPTDNAQDLEQLYLMGTYHTWLIWEVVREIHPNFIV